MSLNTPVKLSSEASDGAGVDAGGADDRPNRAVNSPTVFFGGSIGRDEEAGISEEFSPRNGPWKKVVNSSGFAPPRATGGCSSGATEVGKAGGTATGGSFGSAAAFTLD
jgi:hypothetical protein